MSIRKHRMRHRQLRRNRTFSATSEVCFALGRFSLPPQVVGLLSGVGVDNLLFELDSVVLSSYAPPNVGQHEATRQVITGMKGKGQD